MNYPVWRVPFLSAPMLIPLIAVPHVVVAQFAVGGGLLMADLTQCAYGGDHRAILDYLHRLTRVFVLITVVFGAVTGVGIWWTIGLAGPETTSALIHIFVFGWAAEWAVFVLEIAAAFVFYYFWGRLAPRDHIIVGWIYGIAAWVSLVLITGITAFMLTSGDWTPDKSFFTAFFNPSFLPQVLLRTRGSIAIAALGITIHLSFQNDELPKDLIIRWISRWNRSNSSVSERLFKAMPFFMAFGINAGIVPLLFIQVLYPQFFYSATILQAWFWFLVIPLLIVAYYAVYFAAFGKYRALAATVASILLAWIGLTFSAAMTLTASPETTAALFTAQADAGSVSGLLLYLDREAALRCGLMAGLAFGTLAAFLALDAEFLTAQPGYRAAARRLVMPLYLLGLAIFALAGALYAPAVRDRMPQLLWFAAGAALPGGAALAILYGKRPSRTLAGLLVSLQSWVLVANALARQTVQANALAPWAKLDRMPVRGDWDSFALFVVVLLVVLICMAWLLGVVTRASRSAAG